jgi:hypothetical protein
MNKGVGAVETELWNRAHLKALKLAALVAVGCNPNDPVITGEIADWTLAFVHNEVATLAGRFGDGQIGSGVSRQDGDLRKVIQDWISYTAAQKIGYGATVEMTNCNAAVIPKAYIRKRALRLNSFKQDKRGVDGALEALLNASCSSGILQKLNPNDAVLRLKYRSELFLIGDNWNL